MPKPAHEADRLITLARKAADAASRPSTDPLARSEALAAAPWKASYSPSLERAFREAFADRLEELGGARPARPSGSSGASQTDLERAERGLGRLTLRVSQASIDKLTAKAEQLGCSRGALFESLVETLK